MSNLYSHLINTYVFEDLYNIRWTRLGGSSKTAVILVHGTPFSSLGWLPIARALQKDYCVYLFDLPGFGASQEPARAGVEDFDVGLAVHGRAFAALYPHWGFSSTNQPHVIAHDIGGHAVLRAHLLHGVEYASLCLLDVVAIKPWGSPLLRAIQSNPEAFEAIPPAMFKGMLREYVQNAAYKKLTEAKSDEFVRPWTDEPEAGRTRYIRQIRWMDPAHTEEMEDEMHRVMERDDGGRKRLKIMWAEHDNWIPIDIGVRLAKLTGAALFVRVPEAGHLIQVDQPEAVTYELAKWLGQVAH